jgi:hypothetical protein
MSITIFPARVIHTHAAHRPTGTHVAVRDGRVLGVGTLDELSGWGPYTLDDRLADKVLLPGFVEGHSHVIEGVFWRFAYCGYFDRRDPDGKTWPGAVSIEAVIARLQAAAGGTTGPIAGWGLDPIYFGDRRVSRQDLDRISTERPIGVIHASGHILNVNTKGLELAGLLRPGVNHPGVPLGADGLPTGELKGPEPMGMANPHVGFDRAALAGDERGIRDFARLCVRAGVTTATDLAAPVTDPAVAMLKRVTGEARFPARIVPFRIAREMSPEALIARVLELAPQSTDRLRLGRLKIIVDGSIQGFSARLRAPGYYNGAPNGLWYVPPPILRELLERALAAGVLVHCHTNGDEATDLVLDTLEAALRRHPSPDHRVTLQHGQLADGGQFRRMARLGVCVNLFPNHHHFWGDQHYAITVGPERAERMNACATALAAGVPMAIHSDAPVTPLGPLFTAWCAVNRRTASGRTLGQHERISVPAALHAITVGAATTLKLDGELGTIEAGKQADFAVLDDDPTTVAPEALKDVSVWGTVMGGRVFEAASM